MKPVPLVIPGAGSGQSHSCKYRPILGPVSRVSVAPGMSQIACKFASSNFGMTAIRRHPPSHPQTFMIQSSVLPAAVRRPAFLDEAGQEIRKGNNILADTRFFESLHVNLAVPDRYDGPWIPARCHHEIHQKPAHTAVPVHIRMDVYEYEVTEHDPQCRFLFLRRQIEESRHGIPDRLAVEWHMHGAANINLAVAIAGKGSGL